MTRHRVIIDFDSATDGPAERLVSDIMGLVRSGGPHPGVADARVQFQVEQRTWQNVTLPTVTPSRRGTHAR